MFGQRRPAEEKKKYDPKDPLTWDKSTIDRGKETWDSHFSDITHDAINRTGAKRMPGPNTPFAIAHEAHTPDHDTKHDFRGDFQHRDNIKAKSVDVEMLKSDVEDCDTGVAAIYAEQKRILDSGLLDDRNKKRDGEAKQQLAESVAAAVAKIEKEKETRIEILRKAIERALNTMNEEVDVQQARADEFQKRADGYRATVADFEALAKSFPPPKGEEKN